MLCTIPSHPQTQSLIVRCYALRQKILNPEPWSSQAVHIDDAPVIALERTYRRDIFATRRSTQARYSAFRVSSRIIESPGVCQLDLLKHVSIDRAPKPSCSAFQVLRDGLVRCTCKYDVVEPFWDSTCLFNRTFQVVESQLRNSRM